jgi:hypothetical protein
MIDNCWILHPDLRVFHLAKRGAIAGASNKRINKAPALAPANGSSSSAHLAEEEDFFGSAWEPPNLGGQGGHFGGFNVEVIVDLWTVPMHQRAN